MTDKRKANRSAAGSEALADYSAERFKALLKESVSDKGRVAVAVVWLDTRDGRATYGVSALVGTEALEILLRSVLDVVVRREVAG